MSRKNDLRGVRTAAEARELMAAKVAKARSIADDAGEAGRDLTSGEKSLIDELVAEARELRERELVLEGNESMMKDLAVFGEPGGSYRPVGRKASTGGGTWARAMTDYLGHVGAKTLVPSGAITVPTVSPAVVASEDRPRSILSLIPSEPLTGTDRFGFLRETVRTHNASTVAPGKLKPTSVYSIEKVEDRVRTIAHLSEPMKRQDLADNELLGQYLEGALRAGVELELEDQVLNGEGDTSGVLDDLEGIRETSGVQMQPFVVDRLTSARKAVTLLENLHLDLRGAAWTMTPDEWETYELLTSDEIFVMAGPGAASGGVLPVDRSRRSLWGYPVVVSTALEDGVALFGDFGGSARLRPRDSIEITWSESVPNGDGDVGFQTNELVFRAEGRWGLEVSRPAAFVEVELVAGSGS